MLWVGLLRGDFISDWMEHGSQPEKKMDIKRTCTPNQNSARFLRYLKINNAFFFQVGPNVRVLKQVVYLGNSEMTLKF